MFKNMLISIIFAAIATSSLSSFAASTESDNHSASVLSVANRAVNDGLILHASDESRTKAKSVTSQLEFQSAEKSESVYSNVWLFVLALFWFVMLSNRRGI